MKWYHGFSMSKAVLRVSRTELLQAGRLLVEEEGGKSVVFVALGDRY